MKEHWRPSKLGRVRERWFFGAFGGVMCDPAGTWFPASGLQSWINFCYLKLLSWWQFIVRAALGKENRLPWFQPLCSEILLCIPEDWVQENWWSLSDADANSWTLNRIICLFLFLEIQIFSLCWFISSDFPKTSHRLWVSVLGVGP